MDIATIITIVTALGGFEFIKWLANLKHNKRKNEIDEQIDVLNISKELEDFKSKQIDKLEKRIEDRDEDLTRAEQKIETKDLKIEKKNEKIETLYKELQKEKEARHNAEIAKKQTEIQLQEAEFKRCNVRSCPSREPKTGY